MSAIRLHWIDSDSPPDAFPALESALPEPEGLLAMGGDLSEERLLAAYTRAIFPWYVEGQPILWWSPDPRCVLVPNKFHQSRSFRRYLRNTALCVTFNRAFSDVMRHCAAPRPGQEGTWITPDMLTAFGSMHHRGWAHSVEVWSQDELVGGIYGLAIGKIFFGESMFSRATNASKIALLALCRLLQQRGFGLLDCQVESPHLVTLGAERMPRTAFRACLGEHCANRERLGPLVETPVPATVLLEKSVAALQ